MLGRLSVLYVQKINSAYALLLLYLLNSVRPLNLFLSTITGLSE